MIGTGPCPCPRWRGSLLVSLRTLAVHVRAEGARVAGFGVSVLSACRCHPVAQARAAGAPCRRAAGGAGSSPGYVQVGREGGSGAPGCPQHVFGVALVARGPVVWARKGVAPRPR